LDQATGIFAAYLLRQTNRPGWLGNKVLGQPLVAVGNGDDGIAGVKMLTRAFNYLADTLMDRRSDR
jgi:hypothetical protein